MKDKIFMAFLCATLCVVTNAMGAGVNLDEVKESIQNGCTVREKSLGEEDRETFPGNGFGASLYMLKGSDDWLFVGNDSALMCDTHQMGEFYECEGNIVVTNGSHFFECKTGWNGDGWEKYDPETCEGSEVPDGVKDSTVESYAAYYMEKNDGYTIATPDLCVMRTCKDGYRYDSGSGRCVEKTAESNAVTGGTGSQNAGISGNSANGGSDDSGASTDNSANGGSDDSGASTDNSSNGGSDDSGASTDNSANGSGNGDTVSTDNNEIETLGKLLDEETEKFERSKWRDAEGKFNTARLASDSIAGVVLGTAGGLISSKVIKKKQVENGFEDIKCTIGSQEVADWGDEFRVGIQ